MVSLSKDVSLVIIDANFILTPIQFRVDIYDEIRQLIFGKAKLVILSEVLMELEDKLQREQKLKFKKELKKSLELLQRKREEKPDYFMFIDRKREKGI